jgi:hypothetical protein
MKVKDLENRLTLILNDIEIRLLNLEGRVGKIPDPFVLYYKTPESDKHEKITDVLDHVHIRLNMLEELL